MTFAVVTDSSCDLPRDSTPDDLIVVPLTISFGTTSFLDREQLSTADFWSRLTENSTLPKTAAPSPAAFEEAFRKAHANGTDSVLCLTLSSKLSGTYQSAVLAQRAIGSEFRVEVIDTALLTAALGSLCLFAHSRAQDSADLDTVVSEITELATHTAVYATLDTLEYLKRGGRIGGAQALLGSLLSIKPVIAIRNGVVEADSKQRTRGKAIDYLVQKVTSCPNPQLLTVCHTNTADVQTLLAKLKEHDKTPFLETVIGPVIGTYGGPGVLAVTYVDASATSLPFRW